MYSQGCYHWANTALELYIWVWPDRTRIIVIKYFDPAGPGSRKQNHKKTGSDKIRSDATKSQLESNSVLDIQQISMHEVYLDPMDKQTILISYLFSNCLFAHIHTHTHTHTPTHTHTHIHTHTNTNTHTHTHIYTHIHLHTNTHTHKHIYIYNGC